ncbi:MAG: LysM peptidoglycan-binding domain-containing protein [Myxococcota bacterium]
MTEADRTSATRDTDFVEPVTDDKTTEDNTQTGQLGGQEEAYNEEQAVAYNDGRDYSDDQWRIIQRAVGSGVDGDPGPNTAKAIAAWQLENDMAGTGRVDDATYTELVRATTSAAGEAVEYEGDPRSKLSQLAPQMQVMARNLLDIAHEMGLRVWIVSGLRTFEEQDELYAQGRTAPGNRVTNVRGGGSYHNYGLAVDVVFDQRSPGGPWGERNDWEALGRAGEMAGLEWGGRWTSFVDRPHFQIPNLSTRQLRAWYAEGGMQNVWAKAQAPDSAPEEGFLDKDTPAQEGRTDHTQEVVEETDTTAPEVVSEDPQEAVEEEVDTSMPIVGVATVKATGLNVRRQPNTDNDTNPPIGTLNNGETIDVYGQQGDWLQVRFNGEMAYISGRAQYTDYTPIGGMVEELTTESPAPDGTTTPDSNSGDGPGEDIMLDVDYISQFSNRFGSPERQRVACFRAAVAMAQESTGVEVLGPNNRFQIGLAEDSKGALTRIDEASAKASVEYIDAELEAGHAVVVGVSTKDRAYNVDKITDHFITIIGRTTEDGRTWYHYLDPGTRHGRSNASGKLYANAQGMLIHDGNWGDSVLPQKAFHVSMVRMNNRPAATPEQLEASSVTGDSTSGTTTETSPSPTESPTPTTRPQLQSDATYTVKAGDSLWSIATENGMTVDELRSLNSLTSNVIHPGQELRLGGEATTSPVTPTENTTAPVATLPEDSTYTVKAGDSLWRIATEHGMTVAELRALNGIGGSVIHPGQVLKVRGDSTPAPVTTTEPKTVEEEERATTTTPTDNSTVPRPTQGVALAQQDPTVLMAMNLYAEARGEWRSHGTDALYAIGRVVMARAHSGGIWNWPSSPSGVITQPAQFSWTNPADPNYREVYNPSDSESWEVCYGVAREVISGSGPNPFPTADHYFNPAVVTPSWHDPSKVVGRVGNHIFLNLTRARSDV